jgi:PAS domain S-box-containing protein
VPDSPGYLRRHESALVLVGAIEPEVPSWLRAAGYECRTAATPKVALKALAEAPAQLLLVGGDDSAGGCRTLCEDARMGEAWLLAVTDRDDSRSAVAALQAGADDYVQRPFTRTELLARTRAGVRAAQQRSDDTLLRALMVNVPGAIYRSAWHANHTLALISDEIERISGYPPANFIASSKRTLMSIVHPDDREQILESVKHAHDADEAFVLEYRIVRADGEVRWVLDRGQLIQGPGGRLWMDGVIFDITDRREAEDALRRREVEAARTEELRASSARIVAAADAARRKIERDLHDGAQQRLVAMALDVRVAKARLAKDPETIGELLDDASQELDTGLAELRELARGLHPAGLSEYGLEPALRALAGRASLAVEIERLPDRRLPEVIEVTVFYLVSEAITNAAKHAGAASLRVSVTTGPAALVAEIADDGVGGADADGEGSGLRGLRDRVATLGGTLTVDSPPGAGTRLEARIPLAPWRSAREPFLEVGHPEDGGEGERTIADIEAGRKRVSVTLAREWELEGGLPRIGRRMPVIDHHGVRRATVEIERVALVPFADVGPDVVPLEATGAVSHEAWRERQKAFYDRCREEVAVLLEEPGWWLTDEEPMAVVWFRAVDEQPPA